MAKSKSNKTKVSTETKVMTAVSSVVDFMKQQVTANLSEASSQGKIDVDQEELRKICFYVETSISESFIKASSQIQNAIK